MSEEPKDKSDQAPDGSERQQISAMLESGLKTQVVPCESSRDFEGVLAQLRGLGSGELEKKLVIAGFINRPYGAEGDQQSCADCMYYLIHRKWCDLSELAVPVEPTWWCRLWRI